MDGKILRFFNRNNIHISDIKYLTREDNKTCIYITDGRIIKTFITVKDLYTVLAPYDYLCINKGIIVSKSQIRNIDNCTYHMADGTIFEGRKRTAATHKRLNIALQQSTSPAVISSNILSRFSVLDRMPIGFCVIELIFNDDGSGVDFVFRYCNKEMEHIEGKKVEEMIDQSFYKVFPDGNKKWLAVYTDVAVNGGYRYFRSYNQAIGRELLVRCFQPFENFCACVLIPVDELTE